MFTRGSYLFRLLLPRFLEPRWKIPEILGIFGAPDHFGTYNSSATRSGAGDAGIHPRLTMDLV